jgi:hypothetical protein
MRIAYADPPYPGCSKLYPEKEEVDHVALLRRLNEEYPDGWALSTGSKQLQYVLALCPEDVRVGAWCKTYVSLQRPGAAYAWEPVIWRGGRKHRTTPPVFDWLRGMPSMTKHQAGFPGAKPADFCHWLFAVMGLMAEDELVDLFPGTGAVTRAWETWRRQAVLPLGRRPRLQLPLDVA